MTSVRTSMTVWLVLLASMACAKTPKTPCPGGRFADAGPPLVGDAGAVIVVQDGSVAIDGFCPPVPGTIRGSQKKTKVKAFWGGGTCAGTEAPVRIKAKIVSSCGLLKGRLLAPGLGRKLQARTSACGDGILDDGGGEQCETDAHCPAGVPCTGCGCGAATSTTISSTTTTSVTTTTFQGALAPDYITFTGAETGAAIEVSSNFGCQIVGAPVHSGLRSCQVPLGSFAELQPPFALQTAYARVYHRVDVVLPPSTEAFAPVIVMDVAPQGITAADVGVRPDGTIRFRLRNRLTGEELGVSEPRQPGSFVRVELSTTIGNGTGAAELRLDGVTVVSVSGKDFGTQLLDRVFIGNNPNQYDGAHGGVWNATFDDIAVTANQFPGAGRIIRRQGVTDAPTYADWTPFGALTVADAWSQTPSDPSSGATTPATGDPLAQTMRLFPFDQGIDPIAPGNTIKACQTWLNVGLSMSTGDRAYAIRRRIGGADTDTNLLGLTADNALRSDGVDGDFWRATLAELNDAEIGAVKSGGAGGTALRVADAFLVCEYQ